MKYLERIANLENDIQSKTTALEEELINVRNLEFNIRSQKLHAKELNDNEDIHQTIDMKVKSFEIMHPEESTSLENLNKLIRNHSEERDNQIMTLGEPARIPEWVASFTYAGS